MAIVDYKSPRSPLAADDGADNSWRGDEEDYHVQSVGSMGVKAGEGEGDGLT